MVKQYINGIMCLLVTFYPIALNNINSKYTNDTTIINQSLNELITSTKNVKQVLDWFKFQGDTIVTNIDIQKDITSVKYYFNEKGKSNGVLELQYKNNVNTKMILNIMINGHDRIFEDLEAKRILRMFISYNDEFDYYQGN